MGFLCMIWLLCALSSLPVSVSGSFSSPLVDGSGVSWRYWLNDGSTDMSVLQSDLSSLSDVGSTGLEIISYQGYGFQTPMDVGTTGYGSSRFKQTIQQMATLATTLNLTIDLAAGPSQGAGIPSQNPDVEGYNTELVFGYIIVRQQQGYTGNLPSPNIIPMMKYGGSVAPVFNVTSYTLQGVMLAAVTSGTNLSSLSSTTTLQFTSIQNLANNVTGNTVTISPVTSDSIILAFYSRRTGYQEAYGSYSGPNPSLPASWGCYIVDHFSPSGAHMIDNFTLNYLFSPPTSQLSQVGRLIWEDSMEFRAQLFWTCAFLSRFQQLRGYDPLAVGALPAFYSRTMAPFGGANLPDIIFAYDNDTLNHQFAWDYCDTLSQLYMDYISTRNTNARQLGWKLSLQPGYGFTLDIAAAAGVVDVPEIESLAFTTVDQCRQISGGVHLGGANILSTELGAVQLQAYSQTMSDLIKLANVQFAGGVNRVVIHGFPYTGNVPLTTWPGMTTFSFVYSEMHGPRQPGWSQYRGHMSYLARTQYVLRKGATGIVDLAIYRHNFNVDLSAVYASNSLQLHGYSYEYVSPYNLELPLATVNNQRLGQNGPNYKAFIIHNQPTMVLKAANKILAYAQQGLPIIIVGNTPNNIPGYATTTTARDTVVSIFQTLLTLPNVKQVTSYADVPTALVALGVRPSVTLDGTTDQLYSIRRSESDTTSRVCSDYYFLYNGGSTSLNVTLLFETCGMLSTSWLMDTWTGSIHGLSNGTRVSNMAIQLNGIYLQPQQTLIIAFSNGTMFEGQSIENIKTVPITHMTSAATWAYAQLGSTLTTIPLNWNLTVTSYHAPSDLQSYQSVLVPVGPISMGTSLIYWNNLPTFMNNGTLTSTSGQGVYQTTFTWTTIQQTNTQHLFLDCSQATGVTSHTVVITLNGVVVSSAVDPSTRVVSLPLSLLQLGSNTLSVSMSTTLLNALNTVPPTSILGLAGNRLSGVPFVPPNTKNGIQGQLQLVAVTNPTPTPTSTPTRLPSSAGRCGWDITWHGVMLALCYVVSRK